MKVFNKKIDCETTCYRMTMALIVLMAFLGIAVMFNHLFSNDYDAYNYIEIVILIFWAVMATIYFLCAIVSAVNDDLLNTFYFSGLALIQAAITIIFILGGS